MDLSAFRDKDLARGLIKAIHEIAPEHASLMEVCGTHTVSIARAGLRSAMPEGIELLSGPGCPVCVTANRDIDAMIACARIPNTIVVTFGDMMRVPGSTSSLLAEKAEGHDVRVVYSPVDALKIANENPDKHIVFCGVGFETTAPVIASVIKRAKAQDIKNFSIYCAHKTVPAALEALICDPGVKLDALILPGHVSTIIGSKPYEFLAEKYGIPGVVTGFEPCDLLQGIGELLRMLKRGEARIEIAYARGVMAQGNPAAVAMLNEVFEPCDAVWRGLGLIPGSGLSIRKEFELYDATKRLEIEVEETREHKGCRCGDVLRGAMKPSSCGLFGKACTPEHPIGPCMVSSEGSCAAYFRYHL